MTASSFYRRHRLTLSVLGVSALLGVVLPACEMPPAEPEPPRADIATTLQLVQSPSTVVAGQSATFTARLVDPAGAQVDGSVQWALTGPAGVATLDPATGALSAAVVQSAATTSVQVRATATVPDGYTAPAPVDATVTVETRITGLDASPASFLLEVGEHGEVTAQAAIAAGSPTTPAPRVTWTSSAPTVVGVDSAGVVTALQPTGDGSVTLTATSEGRTSNTVQVFVVAPPPTLSVSPSALSLQVGAQGTLTATVTNPAEGGTLTWTSRSPEVATASADGGEATVLALSAGSAWIVAEYSGGGTTVRDSSEVSVTPAPEPVTATALPDSLFTLKRLANGGLDRFPDVVYAGDHEENGDKSLQGFVRFSFPGLAGDVVVQSAVLTLSFGSGEFDVVGHPFTLGTLYVERDTSGALNEGTTGTAAGALAVAASFPTPADASFTVDVAEIVRAALASGDGTVRLRFRFEKLTGGDGTTDYVRIAPHLIQLTYLP